MILGIETSCDETSVALLERDGTVRSNLIASQIDRHRPFGGVVPEIASREHLEHLEPLIRRSLAGAGVALRDVELLAVTNGPGLIGALLVGVAAAQGLSYATGKRLIPVNHLEGHIFSPYLQRAGAAIPRPERFWSLVVSGGHSSIYEIETAGTARVRMLNRTRDDAAGEVFDKVAKVLGLPYPGGPEIERVSQGGRADAYDFSVARFKNDSADFSFSGLKSNAIRLARQLGLAGDVPAADARLLSDFAASFQRAVIDQLIGRLERLWMETATSARPAELGLAGGVAANTALRERITAWAEERRLVLRLPEKVFCTDNAAMIAFAAINKGDGAAEDARSIKAYSRSTL